MGSEIEINLIGTNTGSNHGYKYLEDFLSCRIFFLKFIFPKINGFFTNESDSKVQFLVGSYSRTVTQGKWIF